MASRQRNSQSPSKNSSKLKVKKRNQAPDPVSQVESSNLLEQKDWSANQTSIIEGGSSED